MIQKIHDNAQKYLDLYKKMFMTVAQTEQYYTSKFSFDLTGAKTLSDTNAAPNMDEHSLQQNR